MSPKLPDHYYLLFLGLDSQGPWSGDIWGDMTQCLWGPTKKSVVCHALTSYIRAWCSASLFWVNLYLALPGTEEVETIIEPYIAPSPPGPVSALSLCHVPSVVTYLYCRPPKLECCGWSIDPYIEKLLAENTRLVLLKKCQDHAGVSIAFPFWNLATLSHWKSPGPRHNLSMILHVWFLPLPIHSSASTYIYQPMEFFPDLSGVELVSGPCSVLPRCPKCTSVRGPSTPSNFALLVFLLSGG